MIRDIAEVELELPGARPHRVPSIRDVTIRRAATTDKPYHVYEVTNRLVVQTGRVEPWFGQPGMGVQHYLPASVQDLLDAGYLREVG